MLRATRLSFDLLPRVFPTMHWDATGICIHNSFLTALYRTSCWKLKTVTATWTWNEKLMQHGQGSLMGRFLPTKSFCKKHPFRISNFALYLRNHCWFKTAFEIKKLISNNENKNQNLEPQSIIAYKMTVLELFRAKFILNLRISEHFALLPFFR